MWGAGFSSTAFDNVTTPFNVQRHHTSARTHQAVRASAMQRWREVVAAARFQLWNPTNPNQTFDNVTTLLKSIEGSVA
jgi:hypothetical protein